MPTATDATTANRAGHNGSPLMSTTPVASDHDSSPSLVLQPNSGRHSSEFSGYGARDYNRPLSTSFPNDAKVRVAGPRGAMRNLLFTVRLRGFAATARLSREF